VSSDIVWPAASSGGGGSGNAAAGPTGSSVPADADYIGFNVGGVLTGVSASTPLPVTLENSGGLSNVNLVDVGGAAIALGQTTQSASLPVTIASNQSAIPVSQSGTWTDTVTQATAANLNATVVGLGTAGTPSGGVVSIQGVSSGTVVPVSISSSVIPTGAATSALQSSVQGTVAPGTAATNSELVGMVYNSTAPAPSNGQGLALQSDAFGNLLTTQIDTVVTGASAQTATVNNILTTSSGTAATLTTGFRSMSVQVNSTGTAGTYIFEGSNDNNTFSTLYVYQTGSNLGTNMLVSAAITATASSIIYSFPVTTEYVRLRIASTVTGGSIQAFTRMSPQSWVQPTLTTASVLLGSSQGIGYIGYVVNSLTTDVASGAIATTTTSATITPSNGTSYLIDIPVTAVSGTNPTLSVAVQESPDSGTNWYTVYTFPTITAIGSYTSPMITLTGNRIRYVQTIGGTGSPSFTRAIARQVSSQPNYAQPTGTIYTDRSGTTSGTPSTSTQVAAYNQQRRYFIIQNLSATATIYVNFTSSASTTNSLQLLPGGSYVMESNTITTEAINVLSATASVPFAAKEG
jgi:hypothetical protein